MVATKLKTAVALAMTACVLFAGTGSAADQVVAQKPAEEQRKDEPKSSPKEAERPKTEVAKLVKKDFYGDPLPPGAIARMGSIQFRQRNPSVAFSSDGKSLLSVGADRFIRRWDMEVGKQIKAVELQKVHQEIPSFIDGAVSPAAKLVAAWEGDQVSLYDAGTGIVKQNLATGPVSHEKLVFSADGKFLATFVGVGGKYCIQLWDVATGKERLTLRPERYVLDFALSPDNKWLAFATTNHVMQLSDATTGKMEGEIVSDVEKLAFSPDGKILAAGGSTGVVTLYEPRTFTEIAPLKPSKKVGKVYGLEFSPDGKWLAVVKWDELVVWNLDEQKEKHFLTQQGVKKIVFAPNSKTLVSTADFEIRLWDVLTGNQIHNRQGHDDWVSWLANSPDGKLLASISFRDSVVNVWEAVTGKPVCRIPTTGSVRSSMFSNDSKTLISAMSFNGALYFSAAVTGKELRRFSIEDIDGNARRFMDVITFSLSPDGKRLTAISSNQDRYQMNILDGSTGKPLFQRHLSGDWFPSRFTPDGSAVSFETEVGLRIEDVRTGRELVVISGSLGHSVVFSPDGKLVAAAIIKRSTTGKPGGWQLLGIQVSDVATGMEILHLDSRFDYFNFSSDGRFLAVCNHDSLEVWDVFAAKRLLTRSWPKTGSLLAFTSLMFMPSQKAVATGMMDGSILVWDLAPETWSALDVAKNLDQDSIESLWKELPGDAPKGYRAISTLVESPNQTVEFLRTHVKPATKVDHKPVERLLADLDSDQFTTRDKAAKELARFGESIEPLLHKALEGQPSEEVRRQIKALLEKPRAVPSGEALRTLRAIQVLERIGTPEARDILKKLAAGAAAARETREAKESLERFSRKIK